MSTILTNPTARRDYHVLETVEAGLVLRGTEVKSLRAGRGQIKDAFARVENGEVWLYNAHIDEYSFGNRHNHDPKSRRKLLLHAAEIRKLAQHAAVKGHALVPLDFHWKKNRVKVTLALAKGKVQHDKREDLKRREDELQMRRAVMQRLKNRG